MFAPHDGVGLTILTNGDNQFKANLAIAWRLFEVAFGLERTTYNPILADPEEPERRAAHPEAASESAPAPTVDLTGVYNAAGYGAGFELCSLTSTSSACARTLADYATVAAASGRSLSETDLYASWPRLWGDSLRLEHISGTRYALRLTALYPQGYGKNKTAFEISQGGQVGEAPWADFLLKDGQVVGFALSGTVGEETMLEKEGGGIAETADAWFARKA